MDEHRNLVFSEEDIKLYSRLDIACRDLLDAMSFGAFILKKGWKAKPWSRGSTYLQQSAFVTSMVVSYGRAFSNSNGWGYLSKAMRASFDPDEASLHDRLMTDRNQLYAHSDSIHYPLTPWASSYHSDVMHFQERAVFPGDILKLQDMCRKVIAACRAEQARIKAKYQCRRFRRPYEAW
ncbi:hypothetical protein C0075_13930 [Rhizobium sp. KAs_5_22]|uniref:hypothetical protein n=1 Tax=Ciceribacter selenitireducens TaxID=448181 RepID=UPI000490232B|nr:hypothetical protein [Ciceribacter selenitireducens]PPJ46736.1 hypothetical protein C0075_13930 [Rhizobium sp. KAs_5_22]